MVFFSRKKAEGDNILHMQGAMLESVKKRIWRAQRIVRSRLGIGSRMDSPDRRFQEEILIPNALACSRARKVLYVGVAWYTYHYYKTFFRGINLTTLDISREQAVFGARNHIVGGLEAPELAGHSPFDTIFLLGVLNYGINDTKTLRTALANLDRYLASDGCCYLTVEEDASGLKPSPIRSKEMIETAESMNFHAAPVSPWFYVVGGHAKTRFYILAKSPRTVTQALAGFPPTSC